MKTSLLTGLSKEDKEEVTRQFKASGRLREQLIHVLERKKEALEKDMVDESHYDSPNWGLLLSRKSGEIAKINEIISLLS